jgi:hypothetical protein
LTRGDATTQDSARFVSHAIVEEARGLLIA